MLDNTRITKEVLEKVKQQAKTLKKQKPESSYCHNLDFIAKREFGVRHFYELHVRFNKEKDTELNSAAKARIQSAADKNRLIPSSTSHFKERAQSAADKPESKQLAGHTNEEALAYYSYWASILDREILELMPESREYFDDFYFDSMLDYDDGF